MNKYTLALVMLLMLGTWSLPAIAQSRVKTALRGGLDNDVAAARTAAMLEITAYYTAAGMPTEYLAYQYGDLLANAATLDAIAAVVETAKAEVASSVLSQISTSFTWKSGAGFVSYTSGEYLVTDSITTGSIWTAERLPSSLDNNAFVIKNQLSGKYLAPALSNGQAIEEVASATEAGVYTVHCTQRRICLANRNNKLLSLNFSNGIYASSADAPFAYSRPTFWTDNKEIYIEIEGATPNEWGSLNPIDKIQTVKIYVPKDAEFSGFGTVSLIGNDPVSYDRFTIDVWNWQTLQHATPEAGFYTKVEWVSAPTEDKPWNYDPVEHQIPANIYTLVLRNELTTPGFYYVVTSEGMWHTASDGLKFARQGSINIEIPGSYEALTLPLDITPTPFAEISSISSIIIKGAEDMDPSICWTTPEDMTITLTDETQDTEVAKWDKERVFRSNTAAQWIDPKVYELTLAEPITTPGTYSLHIPAGFFEDSKSWTPNEAISITWTVSDSTSLASLSVSSTNTQVYDLQGRKVLRPTRGIYIINGRKAGIQ